MPVGYEPEGRMFESCRAHHTINDLLLTASEICGRPGLRQR